MKVEEEMFKTFWCKQDQSHRSIWACKGRQKLLIDTCSPKCPQAKERGFSIAPVINRRVKSKSVIKRRIGK
jgi:hypothetical protein